MLCGRKLVGVQVVRLCNGKVSGVLEEVRLIKGMSVRGVIREHKGVRRE